LKGKNHEKGRAASSNGTTYNTNLNLPLKTMLTREREIVQRAGWCVVCSLLFSPPTPSTLCSPPTSPSSIRLLFLETRGGRCHLSLSKHLRENLCQRFFFFGRASFVFKQVYCAYINIFHFFFSAGGVAGALGNRAAHHTILYFLLLLDFYFSHFDKCLNWCY
jgi:hypothetical protein